MTDTQETKSVIEINATIKSNTTKKTHTVTYTIDELVNFDGENQLRDDLLLLCGCDCKGNDANNDDCRCYEQWDDSTISYELINT